MRRAADILIWHHGKHLNLFFRTVWVFGVNVSCLILKGLLAFVLLWFTLPVFVFFHIVLLVWPLPHPSSLLCVFQSVFFRLLLSVCLFAPRVFVVHPSFSFLFSLLDFTHPVVFFSFVSCLLFQSTALLSCIWVLYLWQHNSLLSFLYKKVKFRTKGKYLPWRHQRSNNVNVFNFRKNWWNFQERWSQADLCDQLIHIQIINHQ